MKRRTLRLVPVSEKKKAYSRAYYHAHKEERKVYGHAYYLANADEIKARQAARREAQRLKAQPSTRPSRKGRKPHSAEEKRAANRKRNAQPYNKIVTRLRATLYTALHVKGTLPGSFYKFRPLFGCTSLELKS